MQKKHSNRSALKSWFLAFAGVTALQSCVTTKEPEEELNAPILAIQDISKKIPTKVPDRTGWAEDIHNAIEDANKRPTLERVCSVIAVIEQESGYQVDPTVPHIARIVKRGLADKLQKLGPLAEPALAALLAGKAPNSEVTFAQRIEKLRTERDLDRLYRDISAAYRDKMPGTYIIASGLSHILGKGGFEDWNPVTTAGSMQVKVSFAENLEEFRRLDDDELREKIYTRSGGVLAGTARLFSYEAAYAKPIYRFADYNAGVYAARNAAFQSMLTDLTGRRLVKDGDILAYQKNENPANLETKTLAAMIAFARKQGLNEKKVRRDALKEKSAAFEDTHIWQEVLSAWKKKTGKEPVYAVIPSVTLSSPKISGSKSTQWFAASVDRRYQNCIKR